MTETIFLVAKFVTKNLEKFKYYKKILKPFVGMSIFQYELWINQKKSKKSLQKLHSILSIEILLKN